MFCGISCKSSEWPIVTARLRNGRLTFFPLLDNLQGLKTKEKNIQLETVIGKGAYGVVHQGFWEGLPVAVKTSLKSDNDQSNLAEAYLLR